MNRSPIHADHRDVVRYCYGIALVAAISAAVLIASTYGRHQAELERRNRLERFHVGSIMLTDEVAGQTFRLASILLPKNGAAEALTAREVVPVTDRKVSLALVSIAQALDALDLLQEEYGEAKFASTTARALSRHARLREGMSVTEASVDDVLVDLDSFEIAVRQLHQLHSVELEDSLASMTTSARTSAWRLAWFAAGVLVVTGAIVGRLLAHIRVRLREHLETEATLRERDQQLLHAQKIQALGTLVGGVAHDFNNILTAVLGHTELLQSDMEAGDAGAASVTEIQKAGERAASLTRQLLAFSRYEPASTTLVDLNASILDIQPMLRRLVRENVSLDLDLGPDVGMTRVESAQIEQILMNLITNACQAMLDGGTLRIATDGVSLGREEATVVGLAPGKYCHIRVADTGSGMTPEIRSRALEPFFTTKARGQGTGLGLSTVHGIVAGSEGHVLVESEYGRGTQIDIYLPRHDPSPVDAEEAPDQADSFTGSETLILIEDDEQVRELTANGLREHGYEVLACSNGVEALRLCREHTGPIPLLLTDVVLPGLSGPDIVEQARAIRPHIAVVYMSGYTDPGLLERVQASNDPLLLKPFKLQELLGVLHQQMAALLEEHSAEQ